MKKWVSLPLAFALALAAPVSAFATGIQGTDGLQFKVDGQSVHFGGADENDFEYNGNIFKLVNGSQLEINGKVLQIKDNILDLGTAGTVELKGNILIVNGQSYDIGALINTTVKVKVNGQLVDVKNNTFTVGSNVFVISGNRLLVNGKVLKAGDVVLQLNGDDTLDLNGSLLTVGGKTYNIGGDLNAVLQVKVNGKFINLNGNSFKIGNNLFVINGHDLWINGQLLELNGKAVVVNDGMLEVDGDVLKIGDLKLDLKKRIKIKMDGKVDDIWSNAQLEFFKDMNTGLQGSYRLLYDENNLYALVTIEGAAKLWKDNKKAFLLSLFYNGDDQGENGKGEGYVVLSWPDMKVYANGEHKGSFKADKFVKSFSVNGNDVIMELKLPYESLGGKFLSGSDKFGLSLGLHGLQAEVDAKGQVVLPVLDLGSIQPAQLNDIDLNWLGTLGLNIQTGSDNGSTGGNTGTGGTSGTGGTGTGGTGTGGTGSGSSGAPGGGTAVGGATDEGVIPLDMPKTGGGGASDWTD